MRFIITGGSGFIGYHLSQVLLAGGHHVTILDQIIPPAPLLGRTDFLLGCVEDYGFTTGAIIKAKPDVIVHLAARAGVRGDLEPQRADADLTVNVLGTAAMAHAAAHAGAKLILASSGALYAIPEDIRGPSGWGHASSYGISKLAAECYVKLWGAEMDLAWTVLRFSNCYGFQFKPKAVIGSFIKHALEGTQALIHGDGLQARDFIHVRDLVGCILAVSERERGDHCVLDVATGRDTGIRQVWELVSTAARAAGLEHDIILPRFDESVLGGVGGTMMNTLGTTREIGWKAETTLEEGLFATVAAAVDHCHEVEVLNGEGGYGGFVAAQSMAGALWEKDYGDMGLDPIVLK
jgi:UDP-glucose 4-epimerase